MIITADCLDILKHFDDNVIDLIFTSPPYSDCRKYDELNFNLSGTDWVDWALPRFLECYRVCSGLTAWVVSDKTKNFKWGATPVLLQAELIKCGVNLREPIIFHRNGIPGSGGNDWLRHDYEFIICASKGKLPYSNPTACGHPPKFSVGGNLTHRTNNDNKVNSIFKQPKLANPGNIIHCKVGGGHMGNKLSHKNSAPFPLKLADFFCKTFCKPGGIVLDCFAGSGTTGEAATINNQNYILIDIRDSQTQICSERIIDVKNKQSNLGNTSSSTN